MPSFQKPMVVDCVGVGGRQLDQAVTGGRSRSVVRFVGESDWESRCDGKRASRVSL